MIRVDRNHYGEMPDAKEKLIKSARKRRIASRHLMRVRKGLDQGNMVLDHIWQCIKRTVTPLPLSCLIIVTVFCLLCFLSLST